MDYLAWVSVRVSMWNRNLVKDEDLTQWEWGIESVSVSLRNWEWGIDRMRVEVRESGDWVRVERVSESGGAWEWSSVCDLWILNKPFMK